MRSGPQARDKLMILPISIHVKHDRTGRVPVILKGETFMGEAKRRKERIEPVIDGLLKENPDAQAAFKAICARGQTERFARDEIGRALSGCLWEVWNEKVPPACSRM